ncbi:MAG TPA: BMP family protein [Candidatus Bathyarchaeia archaeon]|nr:BMP family protein [Candidatus Bathyarchaeia archaeon]
MVSRSVIIGVVAAIVIVIVGAGLYIAMQPTPTPPTEKLKIAVLLPGSITDAGFNAAMFKAATEVQTERNDTVVISIAEGLGQVGVDPTMRDYASKGYKLIFGWTIQYSAAALAVSPEFNDTFFIITAATNTSYNVINYQWPLWEGAFLAGMVAGGVTNSNIIGGAGGYNYPTTAGVPKAFILGAQRVNPAVTGTILYGGVWDDVNKGREIGEALISAGADVLFCRGDGLALGVIQAASAHSAPGTAKTVYMVGDMADQHALAPKTVITSNVWNGKPCIEAFVDMYMNGTLQANSNLATPIRKYVWGVATGQNDIAPFFGLDYKVPQSIKDAITRCRAAMKAGTFSVNLFPNGTVYTTGTF